jgi:uncharacterized protein
MEKNLIKKIERLKKILKKMESIVVAYSGGVDSTFLLALARKILGKDNVLAVTAQTEVESREEIKEAKEISLSLDVNHEIITYSLLRNNDFSSNPLNRCYFCKKILTKRLKKIAEEKGFKWVVDGSHLEDEEDIRYGKIALIEEGIRSPLKEAGFRKEEIRTASAEMNLPTWNKPSSPCLSSRIPIGTPITIEALRRIEKGEMVLKEAGFSVFRLRDHFPVARIEIGKNEFGKIMDERVREKIVKALKDLGYKFISLDLEGYRQGSFHRGYNTEDL